MHLDAWTLVLQTINVVVLIWLLGRFLYRPVISAIAARQAAAAKILADAEASRDEAQAHSRELQLKADALAASEAEVLTGTRARAEAERVEIVRAAGEEAEQLRVAGRADLERKPTRPANGSKPMRPSWRWTSLASSCSARR
jgi:F-type H+-transporting ATPase subunit b